MNAIEQYQHDAFRARVTELVADGELFGSAVAKARAEFFLPEVHFGYRPKTVAELELARAAERRRAA